MIAQEYFFPQIPHLSQNEVYLFFILSSWNINTVFHIGRFVGMEIAHGANGKIYLGFFTYFLWPLEKILHDFPVAK